jgi:hypothetical protein
MKIFRLHLTPFWEIEKILNSTCVGIEHGIFSSAYIFLVALRRRGAQTLEFRTFES